MNLSSSGVSPPDSVGTWLKRLAVLAVVVLLGFCSWFVWRISMVAYQVDNAIVSISGDVKQMSSTGAQISGHLQKLDDRLRRMEERASEVVSFDEVEHAIDELAEIRDRDTASENGIAPDTEREIKHLLSKIRRSGHRFTYSVFGSGKSKSATVFYLQLYAKFKTYKNVIASAEDFIDKVATRSIGGQPYHVVIDADQSVTLSDWLSDELRKYRETASQPPHQD